MTASQTQPLHVDCSTHNSTANCVFHNDQETPFTVSSDQDQFSEENVLHNPHDATFAQSEKTSSASQSMMMSQEKYSAITDMTLELVHDLTRVKEGDKVCTAYGKGICIQLDRGSVQVALSFGTLYHKKPEQVHKILTEQTYKEALDHLEQVRKFQWTMQCEQWNVSLVGNEHECVACLFDKPYCTGSNHNNTATSTRKAWFRRSNKTSSGSSNKLKSSRHKSCDVCGNPVCTQHIVGHSQSSNYNQFVMCVDCQFDLTHSQIVQQQPQSQNNNNHNITKGLLDPNHPQLPQTLDRLLQYFTRMVLHLQYWVPYASRSLAQALTNSERLQSQISLGTGGLSFVGAALGVAGAAALMTPAGPAILLAAVATSATSATIQGTQAGVHRYQLQNGKSQLGQVHAVSDKLLGWHGLCLGILNALEEFRFHLLHEHDSVLQKLQQQYNDAAAAAASRSCKKTAKLALMQQSRLKRNLGSSRGTLTSTKKALEVWNTLAMGSFHTTRHGLTGVGLTSAMGASYSQLISASMQSVPVVGAAFSVGCMAMDVSNIASTLQKLSKPSDKAVALQQVEESFTVHIPSTIRLEVEALLNAVQDLRQLQDEAQCNQQQDLIEQELQQLNFL